MEIVITSRVLSLGRYSRKVGKAEAMRWERYVTLSDRRFGALESHSRVLEQRGGPMRVQLRRELMSVIERK